jgi:hypothetical protein
MAVFSFMPIPRLNPDGNITALTPTNGAIRAAALLFLALLAQIALRPTERASSEARLNKALFSSRGTRGPNS